MKHYIGCCIDDPFNDVNVLIKTIEEAEAIESKEFHLKAEVNDIETLQNMLAFPGSYSYYGNGDIYFYVNSAIEYFYI